MCDLLDWKSTTRKFGLHYNKIQQIKNYGMSRYDKSAGSECILVVHVIESYSYCHDIGLSSND